MTRVRLPAASALQWRNHLAQPDLHWQPGRSAHALAHAWQTAATTKDGLPPEVSAVLAQSPALVGAEALLVLPEHQTPLPGGRAASQTDALVLARTSDALAVIGVEGKVTESFDATVARWEGGASEGKRERLAFVLDVLGLPSVPGTIRYQLLHRTAAAVLEARRFRARHAVLLVHSFDPGHAGLADVQALAALLGADLQAGRIAAAAERADGVALHFAWANGTPAPAGAGDSIRRPESWLPMLRRILSDSAEEAPAITLTDGDPVEVRLIVEPHAIHVEVPVVEWHGHTPVMSGERRASFSTMDLGGLVSEQELAMAVAAVRAERLASLRTCGECSERTPPEWMHDDTLCSGCAQRNHGIVY